MAKVNKPSAAPGQTAATLLVLGDSISAAYGIPRDKGWVQLLQNYLSGPAANNQNIGENNLSNYAGRHHYQVINASISGETTGGALARLPALLDSYQPAIIIIELGGNDGLRGFPIKTFRDNLHQLISLALAANARVLLTGMHIPPNYGPRYTRMFYASYEMMAAKFKIPLVPFLLEGIAINTALMQKDGIHPVAQAQPLILQNVLPHLNKIL